MLLENLFFSNHVSRKDAFHPIMPLITIRPKNKIPAFPVKAGKKLRISRFSSQILKKAHFPAFPAGVDTLIVKTSLNLTGSFCYSGEKFFSELPRDIRLLDILKFKDHILILINLILSLMFSL